MLSIKFHATPSSGSRLLSCGRTDGRMNMSKLIVAFRNFASTPKNVTNSVETVTKLGKCFYFTIFIIPIDENLRKVLSFIYLK